MHFITPDIINQINSSDIPSESVEELWNSRIDQLEKNYDRIKDDLPKNVVKFIQSYDLTNRNVFCKSVSPLTDEHMFMGMDFRINFHVCGYMMNFIGRKLFMNIM